MAPSAPPWDLLATLVADITGYPSDRLTPATILEQVPGWDSYANLQFISAVDDEFGVSITTKEAMSLRTLGDMARFVATRRAGGASGGA